MAVYSNEEIDFFNRTQHTQPFKMKQAHYHDKHELYYLEKGTTKYFVNDEIFMVQAGDMVFVPSGCFHKTHGEGWEGAVRLLFVFDDDFAGEHSKVYIDELKEKKHIRFPADKLYKLQDVFGKIEKETEKKQKDYVEMQKLYLQQMLILISRYRLKETKEDYGENYRIIQDAVRYISTNVEADLSLAVLAEKYAMSPGYFSKQFKNYVGIALSEYINIARVSAAEKLLVKPGASITEVALECGFNDSNYFAAVFKKIKGITPKKYSMMNG
ncbi:MAG: helix-turn-helix domain-containing protein [Clostridia bacterium]|nr:helix-turn-helix domain-containing protein [Clostridia bacterium]